MGLTERPCSGERMGRGFLFVSSVLRLKKRVRRFLRFPFRRFRGLRDWRERDWSRSDGRVSGGWWKKWRIRFAILSFPLGDTRSVSRRSLRLLPKANLTLTRSFTRRINLRP